VVENREVYVEDTVHGREEGLPNKYSTYSLGKAKVLLVQPRDLKKAEQMSNTKSIMKNMGNVVQLGKTRKKAKLILVN
jgi:hypothetical protein